MYILLIACAGSAAILAILEHYLHFQPRQLPRRFHKAMAEHEYIHLIPGEDLKAINALLRAVYKGRGWRPGSVAFDKAWQRVVEVASTPDGGSWPDNFGPAEMHPDALTALLVTLDNILLAGILYKCVPQRIRRTAATAAKDGSSSAVANTLRCDIVQSCPEDNDWLSYFNKDNVIYCNLHRWQQTVSDHAPLSCEGFLCTSKLQVLAHTLAHELVHALVFNLWPAMDRSSPGYLPAKRHGPIFKLLNARLMGHGSDSYRAVFKHHV